MAEYTVIVQEDGSVVVNTTEVVDVVQIAPADTVVESVESTEIVVTETEITVVEESDGTVVVQDVGVQGSPAEEDVPFASRVDFVGDTVIYKGQAQPGADDATNAWRIQQITFVGADEDVEIRWANGNSNFDKVWDDRLSYAYS